MIAQLGNSVRRRLSKLKREAHFARLALSGKPSYTSEIDLDAVLLGEQCGTPIERWVERTGEWSRASCLLRDSPYVRFLESISEDERRLDDDAFLEEQPYYRMAQVAIEWTGSYFSARTPEGIRLQMREFWDTHTGLRDGRDQVARSADYRHSGEGEPLLMKTVHDSDCWELNDGHHRAASFYVAGRRRLAVRIVGEKTTYLQSLVLRTSESGRPGLIEPLATADVKSWPVRGGCHDQLDRILGLLDRQSENRPVRTVLEAPSGYGWSIDQLRGRGLHAVGITPFLEHQKIGRIVFGLMDDALVHDDLAEGLRRIDRRYDLVLCCGGRSRSPDPPDGRDVGDLLRRLEGIAGYAMVLDTARLAGQAGRAGPERWDDESVRSAVRSHTSFRHVTVLRPEADSEAAVYVCAR